VLAPHAVHSSFQTKSLSSDESSITGTSEENASRHVQLARIGEDSPVVAEEYATGWRLIVRGPPYPTGIANDDPHVALRELGAARP
jgi:hypothetical protein